MIKQNTFILFIFYLCLTFVKCDTVYIYLHNKINLQGHEERYTFDNLGCQNLDYEFRHQLNSAEVKNGCCDFHKQADCDGSSDKTLCRGVWTDMRKDPEYDSIWCWN
jgi:hypothetical protein